MMFLFKVSWLLWCFAEMDRYRDWKEKGREIQLQRGKEGGLCIRDDGNKRNERIASGIWYWIKRIRRERNNKIDFLAKALNEFFLAILSIKIHFYYYITHTQKKGQQNDQNEDEKESRKDTAWVSGMGMEK